VEIVLRRIRRHRNDRVDTELVRGIGNGLRVIAAADRNYTAREFFWRQREQLVESSARLKGACLLQQLVLDEDVCAETAAKRFASLQWCAFDVRCDPLLGEANIC